MSGAEPCDEGGGVRRAQHQVRDGSLDGGNGHRDPQVAVVLGGAFGQQRDDKRAHAPGDLPVHVGYALGLLKGGQGDAATDLERL